MSNLLHDVGHVEITRAATFLEKKKKSTFSVCYAVVSLSNVLILSIFIDQPYCTKRSMGLTWLDIIFFPSLLAFSLFISFIAHFFNSFSTPWACNYRCAFFTSRTFLLLLSLPFDQFSFSTHCSTSTPFPVH